jgi:hypothetical protein
MAPEVAAQVAFLVTLISCSLWVGLTLERIDIQCDAAC